MIASLVFSLLLLGASHHIDATSETVAPSATSSAAANTTKHSAGVSTTTATSNRTNSSDANLKSLVNQTVSTNSNDTREAQKEEIIQDTLEELLSVSSLNQNSSSKENPKAENLKVDDGSRARSLIHKRLRSLANATTSNPSNGGKTTITAQKEESSVDTSTGKTSGSNNDSRTDPVTSIVVKKNRLRTAGMTSPKSGKVPTTSPIKFNLTGIVAHINQTVTKSHTLNRSKHGIQSDTYGSGVMGRRHRAMVRAKAFKDFSAKEGGSSSGGKKADFKTASNTADKKSGGAGEKAGAAKKGGGGGEKKGGGGEKKGGGGDKKGGGGDKKGGGGDKKGGGGDKKAAGASAGGGKKEEKGKDGGGGGGGGKKPEDAKEIDQSPPADATEGLLTKHLHGGPKKLIFCYYSSSANARPSVGKFWPEHIDPFLCTHVIFAFADITKDGKGIKNNNWNDLGDYGLYARTMKLREKNPKLKILLAIGGWKIGSKPFIPLMQNEDYHEFSDNVVKYLRQYGFDGLDMDWEFPGTRGSKPEDKFKFTKLMQTLHDTFGDEAHKSGKERLILTLATASSDFYVQKSYEPEEIHKHIDYMLLMTYNYHGSGWEMETGHHSPVLPHRKDPPGDQRELYLLWSIDFWLNYGVPKEKLIVGLPTFGMGWKLSDPSDHGVRSPAEGGNTKGKYSAEQGILALYEICEKVQHNDWKVEWIMDQRVPYAHGEGDWIGFDSPDSTSLKAKIILKLDLAGAFVWSVEMDDFNGHCGGHKYPILRTVYDLFSGAAASSITGSSGASSSGSAGGHEGGGEHGGDGDHGGDHGGEAESSHDWWLSSDSGDWGGDHGGGDYGGGDYGGGDHGDWGGDYDHGDWGGDDHGDWGGDHGDWGGDYGGDDHGDWGGDDHGDWGGDHGDWGGKDDTGGHGDWGADHGGDYGGDWGGDYGGGWGGDHGGGDWGADHVGDYGGDYGGDHGGGDWGADHVGDYGGDYGGDHGGGDWGADHGGDYGGDWGGDHGGGDWGADHGGDYGGDWGGDHGGGDWGADHGGDYGGDWGGDHGGGDWGGDHGGGDWGGDHGGGDWGGDHGGGDWGGDHGGGDWGGDHGGGDWGGDYGGGDEDHGDWGTDYGGGHDGGGGGHGGDEGGDHGGDGGGDHGGDGGGDHGGDGGGDHGGDHGGGDHGGSDGHDSGGDEWWEDHDWWSEGNWDYFEQPEEGSLDCDMYGLGIWGDEESCEHFNLCVPAHPDGLRALRMKCPKSTKFDWDLKVCNHAHKVDC